MRGATTRLTMTTRARSDASCSTACDRSVGRWIRRRPSGGSASKAFYASSRAGTYDDPTAHDASVRVPRRRPRRSPVWTSAGVSTRRRLCLSTRASTTDDGVRADALGAVLASVERAGTAWVAWNGRDGIQVCEDVVYRLEPGVGKDGGALWGCVGAGAYGAVARRWPRTMSDELFRCEQRVIRACGVGPLVAVVRWEAAFIPAKLRWLADLGEAWPGVRVTTYDILDRMGEVSRFSWRGLAALFWRAATRGEMRLPAALVRGTSRLRFVEGAPPSGAGESHPGGGEESRPCLLLASHEETIDLIGLVNAGEVKNKRVARDLLEFLDARKPPDTPLETWDDAVEDAVQYRDVPGMGQFDIDGLESADDRAGLYDDAAAVLAFFCVVALVFGFGLGGQYAAELRNEAAWREMLETGAY